MKPVVIPDVNANLTKVRLQNKRYYDKAAKKKEVELRSGQTVRMQTEKGFDKLGYIKHKSTGPRSYVVAHEGKEYVRNQRHLLPVNEPKPNDMPVEPDYTRMMQPTYDQPHDEPSLPNAATNNRQHDHQQTVTRSGRISRMPRRYDEFDMSRR